MWTNKMTASASRRNRSVTDGEFPLGLAKREGRNGVGSSSDIYKYNSLRGTIRKSSSSISLSSPSSGYGSNFEDSATGRQRIPRVMSQSRECLMSRDNGTNTIGHEPEFRERIPSFALRRPLVPADLQTHFAVYKFVPRHGDELALSVGDAVHVRKTHDDLWCEGKNLKTGAFGIFPSRFVSDILSYTGKSFELSENGVQFFLRFLGSVEVFEFRGNTVLCQAIAKVLEIRSKSKLSEIPPCSLEIDYKGIRMVDHALDSEKRNSKSFVGRFFNNDNKVSNTRFFFNLKDVTFCGCYPNSPRYFGFVTKHPKEHRFACHAFMSEYSTEPVAKAVGQAFRRISAEMHL